jgi:hypothetical protein
VPRTESTLNKLILLRTKHCFSSKVFIWVTKYARYDEALRELDVLWIKINHSPQWDISDCTIYSECIHVHIVFLFFFEGNQTFFLYEWMKSLESEINLQSDQNWDMLCQSIQYSSYVWAYRVMRSKHITYWIFVKKGTPECPTPPITCARPTFRALQKTSAHRTTRALFLSFILTTLKIVQLLKQNQNQLQNNICFIEFKIKDYIMKSKFWNRDE